jgi:hypothetical protein
MKTPVQPVYVNKNIPIKRHDGPKFSLLLGCAFPYTLAKESRN